jgi:hypothetical protein
VFSVKLGFKLSLLISALKLLIIQVSQLNFDSKNQFNFDLCQVSEAPTNFNAFFILVFGFGYFQFYPQLTFKLLISLISPIFSTKFSC